MLNKNTNDTSKFNFNVLQKVIDAHGIKKTNELLEQCLVLKNLNVVDDNPVIMAVIVAVCEEYNIAPDQLIKSTSRGTVQKAKRLAACIFHFEYGLTIRNISSYIFKKKYFAFIQNGIATHKAKYLNQTTENEYKQRYDRVKAKISIILKTKK